MEPLSGDVEGFAPSNPSNPDTPAPIPKAPSGKIPPADNLSAPDNLAAAPPSTDGSENRAPASGKQPDAFAQFAASVQSSAKPYTPPTPDLPAPVPAASPMQSYIQTNLQAHGAMNPVVNTTNPTPLEQKDPLHDFVGGLEAGLQISVSGLGIRGKMPDTVLPGQADMYMRIGSQIGQLAGDLPAMFAGGLVGAPAGTIAGAGIGGATGFVPGALAGGIAGAPIGAMAGAFAAPAAIRKMLIDHYEKGDITSPRDFAARLMATSWEALKGGITGAATSVTGGAVGPVAGKLAGAGAELVAMTTVGSALEGHLPSPQDFLDGMVVLGGLHAIGHAIPGMAEAPTEQKLKNIYAATGETPAEILQQAKTDIDLKQKLLAGNMQEPEQATPTELKHEQVTEAPKTEGGEEKVLGTKSELIPKEPDFVDQPEVPEISHSAAEDEVLSKLGESGKPKGKTLRQSFDDFYAKNVDYLSPLNAAIQEAISKGAEIKESAYDLGRLLAAHMDKVSGFLEFGTRDAISGLKNGEGLNDIMKSIPDGDMQGYKAYAIAKRALELNDRGIVPWEKFDSNVAKTVVDAGAEKFEAINQRRIDFSNRVLDYAQGKGLLSKDQVAAMKEANKNYIPFNRAFESDQITGSIKGGAALKRIFGSENQIVDPILQTYKNTEMIIKRTLINEVRSSFVNNMREGGLLGTGAEGENLEGKILNKVNKTFVPLEISGEEVKRQLEKQGLSMSFKTFAREIRKTLPNATDDQLANAYEKENPVDINPEDMTFFRARQQLVGKNEIAIFRNGVREVYEGSPGVIDSLNRLQGDQTMMDMTTKVLRGFSNLTRLGVVSNPAFGFAHFFRSQIMSAVYSKTGMVPFIHSALSLGDFMKKSELYQQWLYDGGASGSLFKLNENYLKDNQIYAANEKAPFLEKAWNVVKKPFEASEGFIKLTDNLSRFTEYKRSIESGVNPIEAAMRSRDVVPDYAKVGLQRSVLRTGVAFIGAHINSLDRMVKEIDEDPKGFAMKMSVLTAMSAALWTVNKDDEAIDAIPDWQKNTYWNINLTRFAPGYKGAKDATILRLPKPWAPGILFGSGAEVALDSFFKDRPQEFPHFAQSMAKSVLPELVPNMLQPIMDQYSNKQAFTGRPLVPEYKQKLLPEMQYSPYTSETAKGIAKIIGYVPLVKDIGPSTDPLASPDVVENYIKTWGGTMGAWALKLSDYAGRGFTPSTKADPWQDTPFLHQFVSRYPSFSDQRIQDFYENKDQADKAFNSAKAAAKAGDFGAANAIMASHPDYEVRLDSIAKGISTIRKTFQFTQENPSIPAVEKRQILDTLLFQVGSLAKEGNQMMSDFHKHLGENKVAKGE